MPHEFKFYGDDVMTTIRDMRAFLNQPHQAPPASAPVLVASETAAEKDGVIRDVPVPHAGRRTRKAADRGSKPATDPAQVDLEEAISDAKAKAAEPAAAPTEPDPSVSKDDLRAKLIELMKVKGEKAPKELLAEYGVTKIGELAENAYATVYTAAQAAIDEPAEDDASDNSDAGDE